ncbi:protein of unknown function [Amphritea atlantica]|uniref:Protein NO VEIN C-terminal domain-containing protein n=1 Tax=Amphritea atlantica TaxID=355243 RepID=A0A1H9EVV2_9GAMM|nr:DUF3883 domain-containing protein [Amphritea atlantica]SEQ29785.1 protein of unknown function [Amphritea atlantica]
MANYWSESEVEAAVQDYFDMLRLELLGEKYNKTAHRRALKERLSGRSDGSVELKHQNISAVLIEFGIPFIDGYKPRYNYQRKVLPYAVTDYLVKNPEVLALFQADSEVVPKVPTVTDFLAAFDKPPKPEERTASAISEPKAVYIPNVVNYLEREAQNQKLGDAGEQFVINFEQARLIRAGKESLADRIEQVSVTEGPAAGFDIRSFEEDGTDRFIEAKTTKYGKSTPFYVTPNELRFSQENAKRYHLYRVFKFRADPRVFALQGNLEELCDLKPSEYMARVS